MGVENQFHGNGYRNGCKSMEDKWFFNARFTRTSLVLPLILILVSSSEFNVSHRKLLVDCVG